MTDKKAEPIQDMLQSEGWGIISSQFKAIIDRETSLKAVSRKLPAEEYKAECDARIRAGEIVEQMISEATGAEEFKEVKTDYS